MFKLLAREKVGLVLFGDGISNLKGLLTVTLYLIEYLDLLVRDRILVEFLKEKR
jgi:hypothetical protein